MVRLRAPLMLANCIRYEFSCLDKSFRQLIIQSSLEKSTVLQFHQFRILFFRKKEKRKMGSGCNSSSFALRKPALQFLIYFPRSTIFLTYNGENILLLFMTRCIGGRTSLPPVIFSHIVLQEGKFNNQGPRCVRYREYIVL